MSRLLMLATAARPLSSPLSHLKQSLLDRQRANPLSGRRKDRVAQRRNGRR